MFTISFRPMAILSGLLLLQACELIQAVQPQEDKQATLYVIAQGTHESSHSIQPVLKNKIRFAALFNESARYSNTDPNNQEDINKLYGFSDCQTDHHQNSARFGWRWFQGQLQIFAYTYKAGVQSNKFITAVNLNEEYTYELEALDNKYVFRVNGKTVEMDRGCAGQASKYRLFPYFGGDEVAPQKIEIAIRDLALN